ncbi:hypothetical protein JL722_2679 [Aureococcus anophagefferens]|nr:hypothetical protein JL722_2679 [Aureococcus anophagefferens]
MAGMAEAIDGMAGMKLGPGAAGKGGAAAAPSKACNLAGSALDLEAIRSDNKRELLELLDGVSGRKALVLDASWASGSTTCSARRELAPGPRRRLLPGAAAGARHLRRRGAGARRLPRALHRRVHAHDRGPRQGRARHGEIGEASVDAPRAPKFHVFMVPRTTLLCKQILEDELVLPYVTIQAYHLDFVCFDKDVLSLECDHCFCDWNVHGDPTTLEFALAALLRLEQFFGAPRRIQAFGEAGKRVAKTYAIADWKLEQTRLRERGYFGDPDEPPMFGAKPPPYLYDDYADTRERRDVDTLVILDRRVDLVTPMVTPLTYEGLIDELMGGVRNSCVRLDADVLGDVRDLNIEKLGVHLRTRAKEIKAIQEEFRANKDASITEIHDFVKRIPGLSQNYNSVKTHVNVTEVSLCGGGIKGQAKYDFLRREVLQTYGFELIGTLYQLEKAGLLSKAKEGTVATNLLLGGADGAGSFAQLRKALKLIVDDVDPHDPRDIAYVSSGYAPLSCRLVEVLAKSGFGAHAAAPPDATTGLKPVMVVFFVGGVTYAEIAALRFLSKRDDFPFRVVVAATNVCNGSTLIKSLVYEIDNKLQREPAGPEDPAQIDAPP